jgi:site-specific recombinase XerD
MDGDMFVSAEEITSKLQNFEEWLDKSNHSMNTTASYLSDVKGFSDWYVSQKENVFSLEESVLKFLMYERSYRRLSKASIQRKKSSINTFINFISQDGDHLSISQRKFLTLEEQNTLWAKLDGLVAEALIQYPNRWLTALRDVSLVKFLLNTSMKLSEVREMGVDDFQQIENELENGKISAAGISAIRTWIGHRSNISKNPYIWIALEHQHMGRPLSTRSFYRILSEISKKVSIKISPNILQNTFKNSHKMWK